MSPNKKEIAFLFGSGISIPACMPSTSDITKTLLSGNNIYRGTADNYSFGEESSYFPNTPEFISRLTRLLSIIKDEYRSQLKPEYRDLINYEDIYYVVNQIHDDIVGNGYNPLVSPFVNAISSKINPLLGYSESGRQWDLYFLFREANLYFRHIVWKSLTKKPLKHDHLQFIQQVLDDEQLSKIDIFTLNHDTLLETFLSYNKIDFADGFDDPENGVRYWRPDMYLTSSTKLRLFKLHGSVNWFRFIRKNSDWHFERVGISINDSPYNKQDADGNELIAPDGYPLLIMGTNNKPLEYSGGMFMELQCLFFNLLKSKKHLIISGYGFHDKAINNRIIDWLYTSLDRKILIIHPKPDDLKTKALEAIQRHWDSWADKGHLSILPKNIEFVSADKILEFIMK